MKRTAPPAADAPSRGAITAIALGDDEARELAPSRLPPDHPAWQRDIVSISARTRAIIATLRPIAVRVLSFWDHAMRSVRIQGHRIEIDPSGSYRLR